MMGLVLNDSDTDQEDRVKAAFTHVINFTVEGIDRCRDDPELYEGYKMANAFLRDCRRLVLEALPTPPENKP